MYVTILRIGKVCQKWNVPSVIGNSRLVQDFDTKIWTLNQALAKAKTQERTNFFVVLQNLDTLVKLFTFNDVFLFKWLNVDNSMRPFYYVIMFYLNLPLVSPVAYKLFL